MTNLEIDAFGILNIFMVGVLTGLVGMLIDFHLVTKEYIIITIIFFVAVLLILNLGYYIYKTLMK